MHALSVKINSSWQWLKPRLTPTTGVAVFALVLGFFWLMSTRPALAVEVQGVGGVVLWVLSGILLYLAEFFLKISLFLLTFIIEVAGYNGYLSSTAVEVGWVMVRDITNMAFVVILLLIAFGTILGIEQYEWKRMLVKFVLAAILVNFSRIICGVFIDVAQVVMNTFVNGIAATAGGNLITAFNFDQVMSISPDASPDTITDSATFIASVGAVTFTAIVAGLMLAFLMMLIARMVVLWVLVVLSPLAFVLSVVPQTEKYASEWWSEFGSNLITGPVLLFFIWLSFVTVGGGNIHDEIRDKSESGVKIDNSTSVDTGKSDRAGISNVMTWAAMANFAIAVGMLAVGARAAAQIGGVGASWAGNAVDFGKKVATIAGGVALGSWALGKTKAAAGAAAGGLGWAAWHGLGGAERTERISNWAKKQWQGFEAWRNDTEGWVPQEKKVWDQKNKEWRYEIEKDEHGNPKMKYNKLGRVQKFFQGSRTRLAQSRKELEKTQKFAENRQEILEKKTKGVPKYFNFLRKPHEMVDAYDRIEQGLLKGLGERSEAKTQEYAGLGAKIALEHAREQIAGGVSKVDAKKGTVLDEIAGHQIRAARYAAGKKESEEKALEHYAEKDKAALRATIASEKGAHHAAEEIENLKIALTREFNQSHEGQHITKAEAEAKNIKEGFQAEEELRIMRAQLEIFKQNKSKFDQFLQQTGGDKKKAWENLAKTGKLGDVSGYFAAQAKGQRDHEYNFYRGEQQQLVNMAEQDLCWRQRRIQIGTTAAQEAIVEGLMKEIRPMGREQVTRAFEKHSEMVQETGGDDRDHYYSEALMRHMFENGWPDDAVLNEWRAKLKKMYKMSDEQANNMIGRAASKGGSGGISRSNQHQLIEFLGNNKVSVEILDKIREKKIGPDIDAFRQQLKRAVADNPILKHMKIEDVVSFEKAIQSAPDDIYKDLKSILSQQKK